MNRIKKFLTVGSMALSAFALSVAAPSLASASVPGYAGCGASADGHHTIEAWECLIPGQSIYSGHTELYMNANGSLYLRDDTSGTWRNCWDSATSTASGRYAQFVLDPDNGPVLNIRQNPSQQLIRPIYGAYSSSPNVSINSAKELWVANTKIAGC